MNQMIFAELHGLSKSFADPQMRCSVLDPLKTCRVNPGRAKRLTQAVALTVGGTAILGATLGVAQAASCNFLSMMLSA